MYWIKIVNKIETKQCKTKRLLQRYKIKIRLKFSLQYFYKTVLFCTVKITLFLSILLLLNVFELKGMRIDL